MLPRKPSSSKCKVDVEGQDEDFILECSNMHASARIRMDGRKRSSTYGGNRARSFPVPCRRHIILSSDEPCLDGDD